VGAQLGQDSTNTVFRRRINVAPREGLASLTSRIEIWIVYRQPKKRSRGSWYVEPARQTPLRLPQHHSVPTEHTLGVSARFAHAKNPATAAKSIPITATIFKTPNEKKLSDGGRECALLAVKVWKSSQK